MKKLIGNALALGFLLTLSTLIVLAVLDSKSEPSKPQVSDIPADATSSPVTEQATTTTSTKPVKVSPPSKPVPVPPAPVEPQVAPYQAPEKFIFDLVNAERSKVGLSPLKRNLLLDQAARNKAADLVSKGYWSHTSPEGKTFNEWIQEAGYRYLHAGENLAKDFPNVSDAVPAWMNSPTHRENILKVVYQDTGIAIQGSVIVQMFGVR
jgi:uncharacterized protein YkwD